MDPSTRTRPGLGPVAVAVAYIVLAACAGFGTGLAMSTSPEFSALVSPEPVVAPPRPAAPVAAPAPEPATPAAPSAPAPNPLPATRIVLTLPERKVTDIPIALGVPVLGPLSSPFGSRWGQQHEGIDIASSYGRQVRASAEGRVIYAGTKGTYGKLIVLEHSESVQTWYGHLSQIAVKCGQKVAKGAIIGKIGSTGHSTGPHLHFEVRVRGRPVDPYPVLGVRLSLSETSREALQT